ncbi:MAG: LysR substrate-binding domain-containing protein [Burkholderiaceae bacterium]
MEIAHLDFRSLGCFVAVAEELSFARAARRLSLSQPPLTKRIQGLEEQLDTQLLDRTTRRVRLTRAGAVLLEEARRLFAQSEAMQRAVRRVHETESGTLRIGFISSAFVARVQAELPGLTERLGAVEYVWTEMASPLQVEALRTLDLDLGFVHAPIAHPGLKSRVLLNEPCVVAVGDGHPLASRTSIRLDEIAHEPFVDFPRHLAPDYHDRIFGACRDAGFLPDVRHVATHFLTLLLLPASGCGVSIVPASAGRMSIPGLRLLSLRGADLRVETRMLWSPENPAPMLARMLAAERAGVFVRASARGART